MSTHKVPAIVFALGLGSSAAYSAGPNLGIPLEPAEIAAWDISIQPDGTGLPMGGGTPALVGGAPLTGGIDTPKTIANFWGYSTTVFDFIRRAMPWQQPRSLTDNEVYALTAFILAQNKLIGEDDSMNAETLPKVRMPNRDGFIIRFPDKI